MTQKDLRREFVSRRTEHLRALQELVESGEPAAPAFRESRRFTWPMQHSCPAEDFAGKDGAEADWFIARHAIGEPQFQHEVLPLLKESSEKGLAPAWHAAYLEDRIALYEGRPQSSESQRLDILATDACVHGNWRSATC